MVFDRKAVKLRARESLRGIKPRPWQVTLVFLALVGLIPMVVEFLLPDATRDASLAMMQDVMMDPEGFVYAMEGMEGYEMLAYYRSLVAPGVGMGILSLFVTVLISLFTVVMNYGYTFYSLKLYRGEGTKMGDIFSGLPVAGRAIGTAVMTYVFTFLWTLLAVVLAFCASLILVVAMAAADTGWVTAVCVLLLIVIWVASVIFAILIEYRYSLAPYMILTSDIGVMDAIRESKEYMRGHLKERFVLDLSFLGWEALNGLIASVILFGGVFTSIFAASFQMAMVEEYAQNWADMSQFVSTLIGGYIASAAVAALATVPLNLWLVPYKASAKAGFFLAVAGRDGQAAQGAADYIPPQPPQASGIWDSVPQPPAFTQPVQEPKAPEAQPSEPAAEEPSPAAEPDGEPSAEPVSVAEETAAEEAPVEAGEGGETEAAAEETSVEEKPKDEEA